MWRYELRNFRLLHITQGFEVAYRRGLLPSILSPLRDAVGVYLFFDSLDE
jgi:hypothetical protein